MVEASDIVLEVLATLIRDTGMMTIPGCLVVDEEVLGVFLGVTFVEVMNRVSVVKMISGGPFLDEDDADITGTVCVVMTVDLTWMVGCPLPDPTALLGED